MGCRGTAGVHRAGRSRGDLLRPGRRQGANNGSDWSNAWSRTANINQSLLQPGDTVYIAAGNYGSLPILRSGAAGQPLVFKRATAASTVLKPVGPAAWMARS